MKTKKHFFPVQKKTWVLINLCFLLTIMLFSCADVPENPFKPSNVKMNLLLESSNFVQSDNMIADSTGHTVRIGMICHMPKFIDSLRLKMLISGNLIEKDTVFMNLVQTTGYDTIFYSYKFLYSGTRSVQITAYIEDSTTIYKSGVIVIDGLQNQKPSIEVSGQRNPVPNSPCTLFVNGTDDSHNLAYSMYNYPAGATFVNRKFIWTPSPSDTGLFNITFKVTDSGIPPLSDSVTVPLAVNLTLPKPLKPQNLIVLERKAVSVKLKWNTAGYTGNFLIFRSSGSSYVLRNSIYDTTFTDVVSDSAYFYYVLAKNSMGEVSSDTITVSSLNLSNPVWNSDSFDVSISEGQQYQLSLPSQCKVANTDSLKFMLIGTDSLMDTITAQKNYMFTPGYLDSGDYSIGIAAGNSVYTDTFRINLHVVNVNRAPVFLVDLPKSGQFVLETDTLAVFFNTVDPDGDMVKYSLKNITLPRSATVELSAIDGVFKWLSASGDSGSYKVDLVADDGIDSAVAPVNVFVGKGNVAPSWKKDSMTVTVNEMSVCSLDLESNSVDLNDDTLKYTLISGLPAGDTVIDNKYYLYSPGFTDSGAYIVKLIVSDSAFSDTMKVTVRVPNVNRYPVISGVNDTTLTPSKLLTDTLRFSDPDNDPITISVSALPSGAAFNPLTGLFTFGTSAQGTYLFSFIASDGHDTTVKNIAITVSNIAAPVITLQPQAVATCASQPAILSIAASGAGTLNYQWRKDGAAVAGKTGAALSFSVLTAADSGNYDCIVMNAGGQVTSSVAKVTVSVPSVKPASVTANPSSICAGNTSILRVTGGTLGTGAPRWKWYSDPQCSTALISSGIMIKSLYNSQIAVEPAKSGTYKYYVRAEGTCNTTIDSVTLTVLSVPSKPVPMNDTIISLGDTVELSTSALIIKPILNSISSIFDRTATKWYSGSCGETALTSTSVSPSVTTKYYVRSENGSCSSACDSVTVTVKNFIIIDPVLPIITTGALK